MERIKLQKLWLLHNLPRVCGYLAYQLLLLLNPIPQGNKDASLIFTVSKVLCASNLKDVALAPRVLVTVNYKFYMVISTITIKIPLRRRGEGRSTGGMEHLWLSKAYRGEGGLIKILVCGSHQGSWITFPYSPMSRRQTILSGGTYQWFALHNLSVFLQWLLLVHLHHSSISYVFLYPEIHSEIQGRTKCMGSSPAKLGSTAQSSNFWNQVRNPLYPKHHLLSR